MISISFVVGLIVVGLFVLLSVVSILGGRAILRHDLTFDSDFLGPLWIWVGSAFLTLTLGISAWGFYPYDMQYHRYKHVEGTVDVAEARMLADGDGGTTQNFAVRFKETGETYRCDDTRCSLLKPGDYLSLWCIREWQYASTSGWNCRFDKTRQVGK